MVSWGIGSSPGVVFIAYSSTFLFVDLPVPAVTPVASGYLANTIIFKKAIRLTIKTTTEQDDLTKITNNENHSTI